MSIKQLLPIIISVLLSGCLVKKAGTLSDLLDDAKEKFKGKQYMQCLGIIQTIEDQHLEASFRPEILELACRAHYLIAKNTQLDSEKKKNYVNCIQIANTLTQLHTQYSLESGIYLLKTKAYLESQAWNLKRSDNFIREAMTSIKEFFADMDKYQKDVTVDSDCIKQMKELRNECLLKLTNKRLSNTKIMPQDTPEDFVRIYRELSKIGIEHEDTQVMPEVCYNKLINLQKTNLDENQQMVEVETILYQLQNLSKAQLTRSDLEFIRKSIVVAYQIINQDPDKNQPGALGQTAEPKILDKGKNMQHYKNTLELIRKIRRSIKQAKLAD